MISLCLLAASVAVAADDSPRFDTGHILRALQIASGAGMFEENGRVQLRLGRDGRSFRLSTEGGIPSMLEFSSIEGETSIVMGMRGRLARLPSPVRGTAAGVAMRLYFATAKATDLNIAVRRPSKDEFVVSVYRWPGMPGGHRRFVLDAKFQVQRVILGR